MKKLDEIIKEFEALKTTRTVMQFDQDQLILLGAILGLSWVLEQTREPQPALSGLMRIKLLAVTPADHENVRQIHMGVIEEVLNG